jgi:excisionase family DNA binding protein
MTSTDEFLTPEAAARYLYLSPQSLRRAVRRGDLRCARLGRLVRFRRAWLLDWADTQAAAASKPPVDHRRVGQ